jgi:hypothetical protein
MYSLNACQEDPWKDPLNNKGIYKVLNVFQKHPC